MVATTTVTATPTTTALTTLAMVTVAAAMATNAEPMSGLDLASHLTSPGNHGGACPGEPGRAAVWTQHINKKSKNPISKAE